MNGQGRSNLQLKTPWQEINKQLTMLVDDGPRLFFERSEGKCITHEVQGIFQLLIMMIDMIDSTTNICCWYSFIKN